MGQPIRSSRHGLKHKMEGEKQLLKSCPLTSIHIQTIQACDVRIAWLREYLLSMHSTLGLSHECGTAANTCTQSICKVERQENQKFKATHCGTVSLRPAEIHEILSQKSKDGSAGKVAATQAWQPKVNLKTYIKVKEENQIHKAFLWYLPHTMICVCHHTHNTYPHSNLK